MPHVSDVRATSHDRHDPMLVAALAADDLAGTDRDQAIALTRTCTECAALHAGLATLGLVGLLVGNVQISMGGSAGAAPQFAASAAAAPAPAGAPNPNITSYDSSSTASGAAEGQVPVVAPAASAAAASTAPRLSALASAAASGSADQVRAGPLGVLPDKSAASQPAAAPPAAGPLAATVESPAPAPEPARPLNLLFGAAVIVGIALFVASTLRSRRPV